MKQRIAHISLVVRDYDEAIQFIKAQYCGLTGLEIDAAEQTSLELK